MVLGILTGALLRHIGLGSHASGVVIESLELVTRLFLRLLRMIVAPLVLSTMILGIAQMQGVGTAGRVALRAMLWFMAFSLLAIVIGLALANFFAPGADLHLHARVVAGAATAPTMDIFKIIEEAVPVSIVEASAQNKIMQIVVFAVFTGVAIGKLGEKAALVRSFAQQVSATMFRIAGFIVPLAPLAVFCSLAAVTMEHGLGMVTTLGCFVAEFYAGLATMALLITLIGTLFLGSKMLLLLKLMREPLLIAFSTASSDATLPSTFEAVRELGVPERVVGLVLPLGYAFNLDGTLIYSSFALLFIAQAYGVALSIPDQIGILLFLLLANKGAAGVPRTALVTLTLTLQMFGLPPEGVALILGVDAILDMGRTTINVFGNAVATAAIARMTGELPSR